eukprot:gene50629-biopygen41098
MGVVLLHLVRRHLREQPVDEIGVPVPFIRHAQLRRGFLYDGWRHAYR